jgi:hypothetical protein
VNTYLRYVRSYQGNTVRHRKKLLGVPTSSQPGWAAALWCAVMVVIVNGFTGTMITVAHARQSIPIQHPPPPPPENNKRRA